MESVILNFRVEIRYFYHDQGLDDMKQNAPSEHNDCTSVISMYKRIALLQLNSHNTRDYSVTMMMIAAIPVNTKNNLL